MKKIFLLFGLVFVLVNLWGQTDKDTVSVATPSDLGFVPEITDNTLMFTIVGDTIFYKFLAGSLRDYITPKRLPENTPLDGQSFEYDAVGDSMKYAAKVDYQEFQDTAAAIRADITAGGADTLYFSISPGDGVALVNGDSIMILAAPGLDATRNGKRITVSPSFDEFAPYVGQIADSLRFVVYNNTTGEHRLINPVSIYNRILSYNLSEAYGLQIETPFSNGDDATYYLRFVSPLDSLLVYNFDGKNYMVSSSDLIIQAQNGAVTINGDSIFLSNIVTDNAITELYGPDPITGKLKKREISSFGGGGSSTFTSLSDTPSNYTGQAGKIAAVNSGETAIEFVEQTSVRSIIFSASSPSDTLAIWVDNSDTLMMTNEVYQYDFNEWKQTGYFDLLSKKSRPNLIVLSIDGQSNAGGLNQDTTGFYLTATPDSVVGAWNGSSWVIAQLNNAPFRTTGGSFPDNTNIGFLTGKRFARDSNAIVRLIVDFADGQSITAWTNSPQTHWNSFNNNCVNSGVDLIDYHIWWQGEADNDKDNQEYIDLFDSLYIGLLNAQPYFDTAHTKTVVCAVKRRGTNRMQFHANQWLGSGYYHRRVGFADSRGLEAPIADAHMTQSGYEEMASRAYVEFSKLPKLPFERDYFKNYVEYNFFTSPIGPDTVARPSVIGSTVGVAFTTDGRIISTPANGSYFFSTDILTGERDSIFFDLNPFFEYSGGCIAADGNFYAAPHYDTRMMKINVNAAGAYYFDHISTNGLISGTNLYNSIVPMPNGDLICLPDDNAVSILRYNVFSEVMDTIRLDVDFTNNVFWGGTLASNGKIYCAPSRTDVHDMMVIDSDQDTVYFVTLGTVSNNSAGYGSGSVAPDGRIYFPPESQNPFWGDRMLRVDPSDDSFSEIGIIALTEGNDSYKQSTLAPDGNIYCFPWKESQILKIDTQAGSASLVGPSLGSDGNIQTQLLTYDGTIWSLSGTAIRFVPPLGNINPENLVGPFINHN